MSSNTIDLRIKYPTASYDPDPDCPYCHGTGERIVHFYANEFTIEHDTTSPCICIFVEHKFAKKIAPIIGNWARKMLKGVEDEKENGE